METWQSIGIVLAVPLSALTIIYLVIKIKEYYKSKATAKKEIFTSDKEGRKMRQTISDDGYVTSGWEYVESYPMKLLAKLKEVLRFILNLKEFVILVLLITVTFNLGNLFGLAETGQWQPIWSWQPISAWQITCVILLFYALFIRVELFLVKQKFEYYLKNPPQKSPEEI
jgi:hypothetical protein